MIELETTPQETAPETIPQPKKQNSVMIDAIRSHKYRFIADPGHAWLEVPMDFIKYMNIAGTISRCSYRKGNMAYLEEDSDAGKFIGSFQRITGQTFTAANYTEEHQETTPIRGYARFK